ncbi:MAG: hypothetical protein RSE38_17170, partial [Acinetobacter sp.]
LKKLKIESSMRVPQSGVMTFRFAGQTVIDAIKTTFAVSYCVGILHNLMQMQQKLQRYAMKAH